MPMQRATWRSRYARSSRRTRRRSLNEERERARRRGNCFFLSIPDRKRCPTDRVVLPLRTRKRSPLSLSLFRFLFPAFKKKKKKPLTTNKQIKTNAPGRISVDVASGVIAPGCSKTIRVYWSSSTSSTSSSAEGAVVAVASLVFLALLGIVGAKAGGADLIKPTVRVTFWGALAMALTTGIGALFGVQG